MFAFSNSFILLAVVLVSVFDEHDDRRFRVPFIFGVSFEVLLFST